METLWSLYVDCNRLAALPAPLPPLLDGLKCSGNMIEQFPENLGHQCSQIKDILAYANQLTKIPDSLCSLNLRHVALHGNRLRALPESLGQTQTIESLLLADNCLESLPDSIADLPRLEWLYVYNNKIRSLP
jgi:Leucine-rich repeat (LRR) protein